MEINQLNFFGLKVSNYNIKELSSFLISAIEKKEKVVVFGYALGLIAQFKYFPEIFLYGNKSDVMLTDGRLFYILLKALGFKVETDLSIPQFVFYLLKLANANGWSIKLLGGEKFINNKATRNIKDKYPGIVVFDGIDGYFEQNLEKEIIRNINEDKPNLLLVGMNSPKKEIFSIGNKDKLNVNIIVPCGGMIDVLAGKVKVTPRILKKIGLATFVRVIQEPRRLLWKNVWETYEIFNRILPFVIWNKLRKNKKAFLPSLYNIHERIF